MKKFGLGLLNVSLVIVTVVMSVFSLVYAYYATIGKNKLPSGVTSTYATTITDPQTGEELPVIEARYYANTNKIGYEVIELLFNCYSGVGKQGVYSRGFQLVYDKDGNIVQNKEVDGTDDIFQYNRYAGVNFETGHDYKWGDKMIIDIDGKTYAVALDGTYSTYSVYYTAGDFLSTLWGSLTKQEKYIKYHIDEKKHNYTFKDLLIKVKEIIRSSSNGTGESIIPLIDLGDFLHIYEVNENGQISGTPVGVNTLQNSYFTMATTYNKSGMIWAKQSMFESVAGDSDFNISGIKEDVDYWKSVTNVTLTENDFVERYSTADNGYYYALSTEKINELKNFDNIEIHINFDISNFENKNVLGFDYYACYGIKVKSLTISAKSNREFKLMVSSLKDTGLTSITTNNVTINNVNSGVEL